MHGLMHAEKMARGEESYQGKLLESRDSNDFKDEFVLAILTLADNCARIWGLVERSGRDGEGKHLSLTISRICRNGLQISGSL